jgi:alpha-mannosidase
VNKYRGILVSETHWDREWYLSFQEFRKWLVKLIDDLVDNLPKNPDFKYFMLDGQTVVLEDYLEIRPEKRDQLFELIRKNRIQIGPFYVLADEFLESGEGIIRNLLLGHKISQDVGVQPMKVGYVPDTFGHIWQLPQILRGFGIPSMYYYRGYPPVFGNHEEYAGKNENTPLEHWYASPDGSKVICLHHITGYGNAAGITENPRPEDEFPYLNGVMRIGGTFEQVKPRIKTDLILLMNGSDHRQAEWKLPDLIARWNAMEELQEDYPITLEHGTMAQYFGEIQKAIDKGLELPIITGEARGSMYTQVTPGCISTRMYLKLLNWECTRELEKYAEPFSTLSWFWGAQYQGAYIAHAWKWLIQNHPHDSICGCSLDRVHADMVTRFYWSFDNASDVSNYACAALLTGINQQELKTKIKAKLGTDADRMDIQLLGVFNPHPYGGPFVVEDYVSLNPVRTYRLFNLDGDEISNVTIESIPDFRADIDKGQYLYKRFQHNYSLGKVTAILSDVPACGYRIYCLAGVEGKSHQPQPTTWTPTVLKSKSFDVTFNSNGSISLKNRTSGEVYQNVNVYEDGPDDGDEYDWAPLPGEKIYYTLDKNAEYRVLNANSVFTEIEASIAFSVPFELLGDADTKRVRSPQMVLLNLKTVYRVYSASDRIDVKTTVINKAKGHRLRAIVPSGLKVTHSFADDHFMVMPRTITLPRDDGWYQDMQGIYHQDTFVDLNDGTRGIAVFNRGLCEFEAIETPKEFSQTGYAIALTLYRSVAWLSQKGHLGRKSGLNGPNLQTPGAQLMDHRFEFEYAIYPHSGTWENAKIYQHAYAYNAPPKWFSEKHSLRNEMLQSGSIPAEASFVAIDNPNVVMSALKRSDRIGNAKDGIIVRVFNPMNTEQKATFIFNNSVQEIAKTNLLEEDLEKLSLTASNNRKQIQVTISPYSIVSYRVK